MTEAVWLFGTLDGTGSSGRGVNVCFGHKADVVVVLF